MVNETVNNRRLLWSLLPCAIILTLAAWARGAEYDEQYTLFLTAGVPRPDWPDTVFPAGLARTLQAGRAGMWDIARDLRLTDVHPPLYFWCAALWRAVVGDSLFAARLFSVAMSLGALALAGRIAQTVSIPPVRAMFLTLGCYAFTYTSVIARGFALAQLLLLGGVLCLLISRRARYTLTAGALFGAATLTNYLAVFVAGACLAMLLLEVIWPRWHPDEQSSSIRRSWAAAGALVGFAAFIPADLWWFLAQKSSRDGQFPPFSVVTSLTRLASRIAGAILGGLPLYIDGIASVILTGLLGVAMLGLAAAIFWYWRGIGHKRARFLFAAAAAAPAIGLLLLGAVFNNSPIELRYLAFSTPFVALLLAGALPDRATYAVLAVQSASIAGLMFAQPTMQPGREAARGAAELAGDGIVLLPRGNDGVGVVGAFAIEAPPALPLLLVRSGETPAHIASRLGAYHRVVLALLAQDEASRAALPAMRLAVAGPGWREVARRPNVEVYERIGDGE